MPQDHIRAKTGRGSSEKPKARSVAWQASQDVLTLYSNHFQILTGPWDFTIRLGQINVLGEAISAKEMLRVLLSPASAKGLVRILTAQLKDYESRYGEVVDIAERIGIEEKSGEDATP
ncbi:MAG TPA: DUF3467 domain-containing protein [Thermoanaerobaculia bacterium]|jgi:hypothetical protein|nr:DUF3467 domain-containing protein [Thermoanaerobaculia bacterium]